MSHFQLPESVKDRNLLQFRSRLKGATPESSRPKSSGNPVLAMVVISALFVVIYFSIGALITGKSAIHLAIGLSEILGQFPLLSVLMLWMSVIGLATIIHEIFAGKKA
ncbi:MAG: hypothetical protein PHV02_07270 [Rhodocyclaceae bacterium]|nr:hypothetical protein [Rhodocyclaceae bacterium]